MLDKYFMLHRLQDNLIALKVEYRSADERQQFYLEPGNIEMAKLTSDRINILLKEIRLLNIMNTK